MFYPLMSRGGMDASATLATATANEAAANAREARTNAEFMQHDIERLFLTTQALWTFMKQKHGYTDEDLTNMVAQIEAKRGETNAVPTKDAPVTCPGCGRTNTASRQYCIYCGKQLMANPFAR